MEGGEMSGHRYVLKEATKPGSTLKESKGRWLAKLIEADVQGASGYYPGSVLERDGAQAFPKGLQMFIDHPTYSDEFERPERSFKDLAGVLEADAYYDANGADGPGLYAPVKFYESWKNEIQEKAEHTGLSIRAIGIGEDSPVTGEFIITELVEGLSVDVVTRAGAKGRLVSMTESARKGINTDTQLQPQLFNLAESDKAGLNALGALITKLTESLTAFGERMDQVENNQSQQQEQNEQQSTEEQAEALPTGELVSKLVASGLPTSMQTELANAYKAGDDFDAAIAQKKQQVEEVAESLRAQGTATGGVLRESSGQGGVDHYKDALAMLNAARTINSGKGV